MRMRTGNRPPGNRLRNLTISASGAMNESYDGALGSQFGSVESPRVASTRECQPSIRACEPPRGGSSGS
jgi:hypothetical protein